MQQKQHLLNYWQHLNIDSQLVEAFKQIPRELFVLPEHKSQAYLDNPLPTIRGQSVSQPTTVMIMLQLLDLKQNHTVFEVGAGVGYQAAIIAKVIGDEGTLITSEIVPELVHVARKNLDDLQIRNATVLETNGGEGHAKEAPYDRIIITAACPSIPQALVDQLKVGGIIVAPVGDIEEQTMVKGVKREQGLDLEFVGKFCFVPMKGKQGFHGYRERESD